MSYSYAESPKTMSNSILGNIFLVLSILAISSAQVFMKLVLSDIPPGSSIGAILIMILSTARIWRTGVYILLTICGFIFWILCLNKLPLSYAYALACSSTLIVAILSVLFLRETVSWRLWAGTLLIALGTALVASKG